MNIKQIIAEEVRQVLAENKEAGLQALKNLEAMPEEELQGILAQALPLLKKEFPKWAEQQGGISEELEGDPGALKKAGATAAVHTPLGRDALALFMTATDRATPIALRVGTVMAVLNLVSPIDIGSIFGMDLFGPLAVMDDMMFLQLMKWRLEKAGLPAKRIYDRISKLAGEKDVPEDDVPENPEPPKKPGIFKRMMGKGEELQERRISKSALYKIIKEELEVVLTNEEVDEMFNLDMSALLDEMMSEDYQDKVDAMRSKMAPRVQTAKNKAEFQKRMAAAKGASNIDQAKKASNQNEFQRRMAAAQAQSDQRGAQKAGNQAEFQKRMAAAKGASNIDQAKKASNQNEFQRRMAAARDGVNEEEEKPSAGLSKKKKSKIAKDASAGKDIGKKGKGFDKVADKAAKRYGSKEAGEKVAAAAMWKNAKR